MEDERESEKRAIYSLECDSEAKRQCTSSSTAEETDLSFLFKGRVYVAKYIPGNPVPPCPHGGRNILIHVDAKPLGGALSPYQLKDEHGHLLENIWQFSKVYPLVTTQRTSMSRWQPTKIIWSHPTEVHVDPITSEILAPYWEWRKKGTANPYAVRYPNGFAGRKQCLYALWPATDGEVSSEDIQYQRLDYIEARKKIYCGLYVKLASQHPELLKIKELLHQGETIQIVEVDGPRVDWYAKSPIAASFHEKSLEISEHVIRYLVNDSTHPFGHGYVIASLLMDGAAWMT